MDFLSLFLHAILVEPLKVEDLVAGFRQNALQAETLRVEWSVSQEVTSARPARIEAALQEVEQQRRQATSDAEAKKLEALEGQIRRSLTQAKGANENRYYQFDFWTDRRNFQSRCRRDDKTGAPMLYTVPGAFVFPDAETTGEALRNEFATLHVTSFGPATENRFRVWEGKELFPGVHKAFIETNSSRSLYGLIPPLALPDPSWNGEPHIVDRLFEAASSGHAELLGSVELDGRRTVLIQAIHNRWCFRGFVDVEQGMLPLRVERFVCSDAVQFRKLFNSHVAICESHARLVATEICRNIEVQQFVGTDGQILYYPVRGMIQQVGRSTSPDLALSQTQPSATVERQDEWHVFRVELDRAMSQENFAMAFPAGTTYVDSDTRESFVAGDVGQTATRFVEGAVKTLARPRWYGQLTPVAVVAIAMLIAGLLAFLTKRKSMRR